MSWADAEYNCVARFGGHLVSASWFILVIPCFLVTQIHCWTFWSVNCERWKSLSWSMMLLFFSLGCALASYRCLTAQKEFTGGTAASLINRLWCWHGASLPGCIRLFFHVFPCLFRNNCKMQAVCSTLLARSLFLIQQQQMMVPPTAQEYMYPWTRFIFSHFGPRGSVLWGIAEGHHTTSLIDSGGWGSFKMCIACALGMVACWRALKVKLFTLGPFSCL